MCRYGWGSINIVTRSINNEYSNLIPRNRNLRTKAAARVAVYDTSLASNSYISVGIVARWNIRKVAVRRDRVVQLPQQRRCKILGKLSAGKVVIR